MQRPENLADEFEQVVRAHRSMPAIRFDASSTISYDELDHLSNQVARFLGDRGVGKGDRVGICTDKHLAPYAVALAAIKMGAVYFALDPDNPAARLEKILRQCDPALVFTDSSLPVGGFEDRQIVCEPSRTALPFAAPFESGVIALPEVDPSDPAYIMFTSGSTGVPKGAVMSVGNVLNFARWAREEYAFGPDSVHTAVNPLFFDNSVFDFYSTFFSGGSLVPFDAATMADPAAIVERIERMGCTVLFCVPSLLMYLQTMKLARRETLGSLETIIFGGEGFPKRRLRPLFEEVGARACLINVYGPTECTCICSSHVIGEADFDDLDGLPPLGALTAGFAGYILDGDDEVVPEEVGELCLGGPGVGLGYVNDPDLTRAAFVDNPAQGADNERIYRTGDLVRTDRDTGLLHFVSRMDLQVKHQGYRVELEEVQLAMASLDRVDEAVALQRRDRAGSQLIGIVASAEGGLNAKELKKELRGLLPPYMIPAKIHVIDCMPKNRNGKTDRRELARQYTE